MITTTCGKIVNSSGQPYSIAGAIAHEQTCARCGSIQRWQILGTILSLIFMAVVVGEPARHMTEPQLRSLLAELTKLVQRMPDEH